MWILPLTLYERVCVTAYTQVSAQDSDWLDHHGLLYTVRGDGVDGLDPSDAFFTVNSLTGDLIQLKASQRGGLFILNYEKMLLGETRLNFCHFYIYASMSDDVLYEYI